VALERTFDAVDTAQNLIANHGAYAHSYAMRYVDLNRYASEFEAVQFWKAVAAQVEWTLSGGLYEI
jgi:hypothetical protein